MEKILDFEGEVTYRFQCDCLAPAHALDITVFKALKDWVEIIIWQDANSFSQRLKWAWKMIRTGKGFEGEVVLREEDIPELRRILGEKDD